MFIHIFWKVFNIFFRIMFHHFRKYIFRTYSYFPERRLNNIFYLPEYLSSILLEILQIYLFIILVFSVKLCCEYIFSGNM